MNIQAPKIDDRSYDDIANETTELVKKNTNWRPGDDVQPDAGLALIRIFSKLAHLVSDRLNKVPDKNFLAFLSLIGNQLKPPIPAKVPLTFYLVDGSPVDAFVPSNTQVAAPETETEAEVVFTTEEELVVTRSQLKAVFVRDPLQDRYSDNTPVATGMIDGNFPAFTGNKPIEHSLYLACDEFLTLPSSKNVTLTFHSTQASDLKLLPISWSTWDGESWNTIFGIVEGLTVELDISLPRFKVNPGKAIDGAGREIILTEIKSFNLDDKENYILADYRNKNVLIVISSASQIEVVKEEYFAEKSGNTYIRLAYLKVDENGKITHAPLVRESSQEGENQEGQESEEEWVVVFNNLSTLQKSTINGQEKGWLKGSLNTPLVKGNLDRANNSLFNNSLGNNDSPNISKIDLQVNIDQSGLEADICLLNTTQLDISKDFFPFGEQPKFNDSLYLACQEALSQSGCTVTLDIKLSETAINNVNTQGGIELVWEVGIGQKWQEIGRSNSTNSNLSNHANFNDNTQAFTQEGIVTFQVPDTIQEQEVNGTSNYWLRVRIIKGNYGITTGNTQSSTLTYLNAAASIRATSINVDSVRGFMPGDIIKLIGESSEDITISAINPSSNQITVGSQLNHNYNIGTTVKLIGDVLAPPSFQSLSISYTQELSTTSLSNSGDAKLHGLTYNDFQYVNLFDDEIFQSFQLFTTGKDPDSAIYLGFDQPFPNRLITLYAQVEPLSPGNVMSRTTQLRQAVNSGENTLAVKQVWGFKVKQIIRVNSGGLYQEDQEILGINQEEEKLILQGNLTHTHPAGTSVEILPDSVQIRWEYQNADGWESLGAIDETDSLTERGLIRFIGVTDWISTTDFNQSSLYWLRVRWDKGDYLVQPHLRRILTNTIWASQVTLHPEEILGSSTGNPDQSFSPIDSPILPGQVLEVREILSETERQNIINNNHKNIGKDSLTEIRDQSGNIEETWVRWKEVTDFYGSQKGDRHYVLNHLTGEIRFGDGQRGMIPPLGQNNVRLSYRSGGGTQGNRKSQSVTQLKTTIPYIDRVVNLESASGGVGQQTLEQIKTQGPTLLRHRNRAVTLQDLEDLARDSSSNLARVKAITPKFNPKSLQWLPNYHLILNSAGTITITLDNLPLARLQVKIYGPGQGNPYESKVIEKTETAWEYTVTPEQFQLGSEWKITFKNVDLNQPSASVTGKCEYPGGVQSLEFSYPSPNPNRTDTNNQIIEAGRVELIIVPQSEANQPTPSIGLLNWVETYIKDRSTPTFSLNVTEPDWVKITVSATIVPQSLQDGDRIKQTTMERVTQFLHPLTGGDDRTGWEFGRIPHESDLYGLIESISGVDYVDSLTIEYPELNEVALDRFLIYSGVHQIKISS